MPASYPGALATLDVTWSNTDLADTVHPAHHTALAEEVNAVEAELGVNPSASFTDVATRLNAFTTVRKTADQTNTTVTPANVTDMSFPVVSSISYSFEFWGFYSSSLATAGIGLSVTTPTFAAGDLQGGVAIGGFGAAGASETYQGSFVASGTEVVSTAVSAINTLYPFRVWGQITPNASGNIQLRFRAEVAATITLKKGCHGRLYTG